ncbi:YdeI/OmpD-associated family protein [Spirosoma sp. KUDC1026]|uniref:YdeI/OmpD-associated family protein n=1 Tax=Spirosoma sp. KUDC1026 TaxID=2745947 RepID=UPI00159BB469|nr:YdeI/OmpD-associated family protein [Spirosoma sp. KUDC1026]QKZ12185.1 DUF1905 domain-containing protein [Spirosoma sp. KUDC1026]
MYTFTALLQRFDDKGEKTGWTYVTIPVSVSEAMKPGQKTSYRVKGTLDNYAIKQVALVPMGNGQFIIAVNATMRRGIRKEAGATVQVSLDIDDDPFPISPDLIACLEDEPAAREFFTTLPKGHQQYFSNWIESAKTIDTKAKRLTQAVTGLAMGLGYGETIRHFKQLRD